MNDQYIANNHITSLLILAQYWTKWAACLCLLREQTGLSATLHSQVIQCLFLLRKPLASGWFLILGKNNTREETAFVLFSWSSQCVCCKQYLNFFHVAYIKKKIWWFVVVSHPIGKAEYSRPLRSFRTFFKMTCEKIFTCFDNSLLSSFASLKKQFVDG